MINLNQEFEVVVVETTGDVSVTTYFKNYTDYAKDKVMIEGEQLPPYDLRGVTQFSGRFYAK